MVARAPRSGLQVARSGERETAYRVVREAIAPANVYYRAELHFMAGWIALRFLSDPAAALAAAFRRHSRRVRRRPIADPVACWGADVP
jgi:hypothetical protein